MATSALSPAATPAVSASSASSSAVSPVAGPAESKPDYKVWNPPRDSGGNPLPNLPDSYYNPTKEELRAAFASQQKLAEAVGPNAPLRTKAFRDAEEKVKRAKWPETHIRVKFPDRTMLEKTFLSTDKIKSVYAFVRGSLRDDVKPIKFVLYQSPPRQEFKVSDPKVKDLSLYDLHLAPSSVLMLSFEDPSLNQHDLPPPLLPEVLAQAQDLPAPPPMEIDLPKPPPQPRRLGDPSPSSSSAKTAPKSTVNRSDKDKDKEARLARLLKLTGGKK